MENRDVHGTTEFLRLIIEQAQHRDQLKFEREKWDAEQSRVKRRRLFDGAPLNATVVVALIGAFLTGGTAYRQIAANRDLERQKYESQLILKALEPTDSLERIQALSFLVQTGLISDPDGKIKAATQARRLPQFPALYPVSSAEWAHFHPLSGTVLEEGSDAPIQGARVYVVGQQYEDITDRNGGFGIPVSSADDTLDVRIILDQRHPPLPVRLGNWRQPVTIHLKKPVN